MIMGLRQRERQRDDRQLRPKKKTGPITGTRRLSLCARLGDQMASEPVPGKVTVRSGLWAFLGHIVPALRGRGTILSSMWSSTSESENLYPTRCLGTYHVWTADEKKRKDKTRKKEQIVKDSPYWALMHHVHDKKRKPRTYYDGAEDSNDNVLRCFLLRVGEKKAKKEKKGKKRRKKNRCINDMHQLIEGLSFCIGSLKPTCVMCG
ncbi:hypothetical protein F4809DRAFT_71612 [Biscogniauxia mediterranea]|nr:hypothetical protein F4809DRAFT_71612 [Biscogniauxia mediterranea]